MGLDFTYEPKAENAPDTPHWAYSGFMRFRRAVAASIRINIDEMGGFGGDKPWDKSHPLTPFLYHSDCDGDLSPSDCGLIYPVLQQVLSNWPDDADKQRGQKLCECMKFCAENNVTLIFT